MFSTDVKKYTNITYGKSKNITPNLTCLQCKNDSFRHHTAVRDSRLKAGILGNTAQVFGNKYNIFTCSQCGFIMNYSGDITYVNN